MDYAEKRADSLKNFEQFVLSILNKVDSYKVDLLCVQAESNFGFSSKLYRNKLKEWIEAGYIQAVIIDGNISKPKRGKSK